MTIATGDLSSSTWSSLVKQQILVVDDDDVLGFYVRNVLETFGLDATIAKNGEEALSLLENSHFDMVLLDVNLPGQDGYEVCRKVRRMHQGDSLPIIMITGMDDINSIDQAFQVGATDFVTKPVNWQILKNRIRYMLRVRGMSNSLYEKSSLVDAIPDSIIWLDNQGYILDTKLANESKNTLNNIIVPGKKLNDVMPVESARKVEHIIEKIKNGSGLQMLEFELSHGSQTSNHEMRMVSSTHGGILVILRDFTQRHTTEKHIRHLAYHDQFTGLPKMDLIKKKLCETLQQASSIGGLVAVIRIQMTEMDHISSVIGVDGRNELFRLWALRVSDTLSSIQQPQNDLIMTQLGRINEGGLAIIIGGIPNRDVLVNMVQNVENCINDTFKMGDYEINIACRVGVAIYPDDDIDGMQLLDKADLAIEEVRRSNRTGTSYYTQKTRDCTLGRINMLRDLKRSIDNNELHLAYQPKVDAKSGLLVGVEALVRWDSPVHGSVSPVQFIPLAEEGGLMIPLGELVIYEACHQIHEWNKSSSSLLPVAINFSGHQFNQHGMVANLQNAMNKYGINNNQIEVELTESVAVNNEAQVKRILHELKELGIRTAIDDFGTGYSSLSSLRNFPFSILKIDRSFVQHITNNVNAASITEAIINMGHALGLEVVAEGVEDEGQLAYLRGKRCDVIQGYLTGKPGNSKEIERILLPA